MGKRATFKPTKMPNGRWMVNVPPSLSETGARHQPKFKTRDEALQFAQQIRAKSKEFGERRLTLSPHDSTDAAAALVILRPFNATLLDAARFYQKHHDLRAKAPTVGEAIKVGIEHRSNRSAVYLSNLKQFERRLPESFKNLNMAETDAPIIKSMLDSTIDGAVSKRDALRLLSQFYEDQRKSGNLEKNPCKAVIYPKLQNLEEPPVYTVSQLKSLFKACKVYPEGLDKDCRPCAIAFAFLAFAGLRPAELEKLTWDDVLLESGNIRMPKKVAKTRELRNVPINETLRAWIDSVPAEQRKGRIVPSRWKQKAGRVRKESKLDGKALQDALRHSYGSYWIVLNPNDMGPLNLAMGHRHVSTYVAYYCTAVTKEEAQKYWKVVPEGTAAC